MYYILFCCNQCISLNWWHCQVAAQGKYCLCFTSTTLFWLLNVTRKVHRLEVEVVHWHAEDTVITGPLSAASWHLCDKCRLSGAAPALCGSTRIIKLQQSYTHAFKNVCGAVTSLCIFTEARLGSQAFVIAHSEESRRVLNCFKARTQRQQYRSGSTISNKTLFPVEISALFSFNSVSQGADSHTAAFLALTSPSRFTAHKTAQWQSP